MTGLLGSQSTVPGPAPLIPLISAGGSLSAEGAWPPGYSVHHVPTPEAAISILNGQPNALFVLGALPVESSAFLDRVWSAYPDLRFLAIVVGAENAFDLFQRLLDEDRLFYISSGHLPVDQLHTLASAAHNVLAGTAPQNILAPSPARRRLSELCLLLLEQNNPSRLSTLLATEALNSISAESIVCLRYDPARDILCANEGPHADSADSVASGLSGFAIRTGYTATVANVELDPRYDRDIDNKSGIPRARLAAVPLQGQDGSAKGCVVVMRRQSDPMLSSADVEAIEVLAFYVGMSLDLIWHRRTLR